jgi:hypothetical protein
MMVVTKSIYKLVERFFLAFYLGEHLHLTKSNQSKSDAKLLRSPKPKNNHNENH